MPPEEVRHELAIAQCELGISLNEAGVMDVKPFHTAMTLWKKAFTQIPSFSLPLKKLSPAVCKQAGLKHAESVYDYIDVLKLYGEMATIYLTLGCTGKAGVMFSLGKQLAESPKCTGSIKQLFLSHYARYLASIGNTEKSLAMIAQVDPFSSEIARDDLSLLQRARACLDKSFVSFSQIKGKSDSSSILLRCFGLDNMRAQVICKIADTLGTQNKFEEEWKWLSQIVDTEHDMFQELDKLLGRALELSRIYGTPRTREDVLFAWTLFHTMKERDGLAFVFDADMRPWLYNG
eukprot:jgi/Hompol1/304/HPOL_003380-RA